MGGNVVPTEEQVMAEVHRIRHELRGLLYRHYDIALANKALEMTVRLEEFAEGRGRRSVWIDIRDYLAGKNQDPVAG